jgi:hypothetical protein
LSYDVSLAIDTGGEDPAALDLWWNYTSNCAPMWHRAGADLATFHGKPASECLPILEAAVAAMCADPEVFKAMDPPNGWGSYETLLPRLVDLADAFRKHPKATVQVSH